MNNSIVSLSFHIPVTSFSSANWVIHLKPASTFKPEACDHRSQNPPTPQYISSIQLVKRKKTQKRTTCLPICPIRFFGLATDSGNCNCLSEAVSKPTPLRTNSSGRKFGRKSARPNGKV